jgi:hypothetical protein
MQFTLDILPSPMLQTAPWALAAAVSVALAQLGCHAATWPGMLLYHLADRLRQWLGARATLPLFDCPLCMSSLWGSGAAALLGFPLPLWPLFVLTVAGVSALLAAWLHMAYK